MPLRSINETDLPMVRRWRNAPEVRRWMFTRHEISEAEHRAWFARISADSLVRWLIHENLAGRPDGVVGFTQIDTASRKAFWGFYAAPDAPRGTGTCIGLEALDHAFTELGLHKLNAEVIAGNQVSVNFHRKLGFQQEGYFRAEHFDGAQYVDVVRFGILAVEWQVKREAILGCIARFDDAEEERQ